MREGAAIGPYRLVRELGRGGMGAVYLGQHALIGRTAAIKVLLPELSAHHDHVDRFFNEARALHAISDPGIVQVYDFGFEGDPANGGTAYIVMELLDGERLDTRLHRLGKLPVGDALWIARQVAGSLGAAHAAGVIHRDLKPENLYLVPDATVLGGERVKILDFGIAKLTAELPGQVKTQLRTSTGAVMGTPVYMSPEQCNGVSQLDHRCDIYSLGCVLYHLLTGRLPFDLEGIGPLISAHLRETAQLPSSLVRLPPGLDELVMRCLAKAPRDRFASMLELQQACDGVLAVIATAGPTTWARAMTAVEPAPPAARPRRRLGWWIAASALAGGLGSGAAVLTTSPSPTAASVAKQPEAFPRVVTAPVAPPPPRVVAPVVAPAPVAAPAPALAPTLPEVAAAPVAHAPAPVAAKPAPAKTTAPHARPSPPSTPTPSNDVYDDRN